MMENLENQVQECIETKVCLDRDTNRGIVSLKLKDDFSKIIGDNKNYERCISFCVDVSGSMHGALPIVKDILQEFARLCPSEIKLTLCSFSEEPRILCPVKNATDRKQFVEASRELAVDGSTNLCGGLKTAVKNAATLDSIILLVTDGHANVGLTKRGGILASVMESIGDMTICSLAVGSRCDELLLDGLSKKTGGSFFHVHENNEIPRLMGQLFGSILTQRVFDVSLQTETDTKLEWFGGKSTLSSICTGSWSHIPFSMLQYPEKMGPVKFIVTFRIKKGKGKALQNSFSPSYHDACMKPMIELQFYRVRLASVLDDKDTNCSVEKLRGWVDEIRQLINVPNTADDVKRFGDYLISSVEKIIASLNGEGVFQYRKRVSLELTRQQSQGGDNSYYTTVDMKDRFDFSRSVSAPAKKARKSFLKLMPPKLERS
jgi:hypothetical protein